MCKYFKAELVIARSEIGVEEKEDSCTNLKRPPRGGLNSITVGDMIERQSSLITSLVTEQLPQLLAWSFLNEQTCSLQLTDSMYYMHSSFQVPSQFHSSPITVPFKFHDHKVIHVPSKFRPNWSNRFSEQLRTKPVSGQSQLVSQLVSEDRFPKNWRRSVNSSSQLISLGSEEAAQTWSWPSLCRRWIHSRTRTVRWKDKVSYTTSETPASQPVHQNIFWTDN